ncbi:protein of unknown function [Candidatus Filomicrobium marinum]|uniref:Uncharacterized protein n=1 Tax=Candidatus Filomicrobium marinum TaxID=1608628 RepID=A0A0D6JB03_9HYPH|nr:protein of unknown function [Candidatus Filomicrobium marinum]CPR15076.1 protein of unknown function [Candidatus Filomicrobium marinum]
MEIGFTLAPALQKRSFYSQRIIALEVTCAPPSWKFGLPFFWNCWIVKELNQKELPWLGSVEC